MNKENVLDDELNLHLLRHLVSGTNVRVNIRAVANDLKIHRTTARKKIEWLYSSNILNPPFYSFPQLYKEFPILVLVKASMPRSQEVKDFFVDDSHIFAAFSCMEGPYNTLLIEFFKDLESYHSWREQIVTEEKIPKREHRAAAHADIFSNKLTFKYNPTCFINKFYNEYRDKGYVEINNHYLDDTIFPLFANLMSGKYITRNDSSLSRDLKINRKTINYRIHTLLKENIISLPKCYFPHLFIPPNYNLVVSMIEVKSNKEAIKQYILNNDNIPRAQETSTGCYNLLIFSAFKTIEHFFDLGNELMDMFPNDIGAIENTILSSKMIHTIKPQKLSLGWIERKLWSLRT